MEATHESQFIPLVAGLNAEGEPVFEQIEVSAVEGTKDEFRLLKAPAFVRGLARGDRIRFPARTELGGELLQRSGNLTVRVFRKHNIDAAEQMLTPEFELLDGTLDQHSTGLLVYSIHVSIGFQMIELLMDKALGQFSGLVWYYGNVYDPKDGATPLNWWLDFAHNI
jgi:hypothetical protein